MPTVPCIETHLMTTTYESGRDELNLAEFPLGALGHRLRPGQKTLRFTDRVWDERHRETITRELTITGTDAHGLPTALDDEVLLGLIQLTRLRGFADRKVPFTRYQLIGLLGWRDETRSYERLAASLIRWTGVTLDYRNAWWNKPRKCWMDETFHVLDNVWLCHRGGGGVPEAESGEGRPASAFVWNEVLFRSFQAGNLKAIDFEFYKSLDSAVTKRLYRFLDKRFFHRQRWEFDLQELAWEHLGLSRNYDAASLKRKLLPALLELEGKGFLQPTPEPDRFWRTGVGQWRVGLARRSNPPAPPTVPRTGERSAPSAPGEPFVAALTERGVTAKAARRVVARFPADLVSKHIEVFDWLIARKDSKIARNPPGFLVRSIEEEYAPPQEFVMQREATRRAERVALLRQQRNERRREHVARREQAEEADLSGVRAFWDSLPAEERTRLETEALSGAPRFQLSLLERGGRAAATVRQSLLDDVARRLLRSRVTAGGTSGQ